MILASTLAPPFDICFTPSGAYWHRERDHQFTSTHEFGPKGWRSRGSWRRGHPDRYGDFYTMPMQIRSEDPEEWEVHSGMPPYACQKLESDGEDLPEAQLVLPELER